MKRASGAMLLPQYRQADPAHPAQMLVLFFSTGCTIQNMIIRHSSLTAIVDVYGLGGNTYS